MNHLNSNGPHGFAAGSDAKKTFLLTATMLVAVIVVGRLLPHAANFAPAVAAGLLAGFVFRSRLNAMAVVLVGMLLSDIVIGYESLGMRAVVYASLGLPVVFGGMLQKWHNRAMQKQEPVDAKSRFRFAAAIGGSSLASSIVFFITTNFAVWAQGAMYELSWSGLALCYVNAIPFFRNAVAGDLIYSGVFFGALAALRYFASAAVNPAIAGSAAKLR